MPVRAAAMSGTPILSEQEISCVFGNIEQILSFSRMLLDGLSERVRHASGACAPPPQRVRACSCGT